MHTSLEAVLDALGNEYDAAQSDDGDDVESKLAAIDKRCDEVRPQLRGLDTSRG